MGQRLGQHFLHDQNILKRIASAVAPLDGAQLVEIGPGRGALTEHLLPYAPRLAAIELDSHLAEGLRTRFPTVQLIEGDALSVDLAQWGPVTICGNLPYYVTSPILDRVLALGPLLRSAVFLVQKEVADRLVARTGSRDYGYLTVRTQVSADVEMLFRVPPSAFRPPPKVESAVVRLTPRQQPVVDDVASFVAFAGACFRQKRKMLRNNLSSLYGDRILATGKAQLRAEQLTVGELVELWRALRAL
ncbi:MAG: ribosomal RNA small subunit methyltransferase A [Bryobacterales bacterium]|nr:ribosomal RNA small subunit methyltransferase A [Bryobacterales bacterium]